MQSVGYAPKCSQCARLLLDAGDELVCPSCGAVEEKLVMDYAPERKPRASEFTSEALGSFLGPYTTGYRERFSKGFSATSSTYGYLKTVSDHVNRSDTALISCSKLVERVCERLGLPSVVMGQAISVGKKLLARNPPSPRPTIPSVSAYSVVAACRIEGITSVTVKEVLEAHRALGKRVKVSALIRLSMESPLKVPPRRPEDYVGKVLAGLSRDEGLRVSAQEAGTGFEAYLAELRTRALMVLGSVPEEAKCGHNPCTLAATAVYAAEMLLSRAGSRRRWITQKDVAECTDTAEYTVREQYREIFMRTAVQTRSGERLVLPPPR